MIKAKENFTYYLEGRPLQIYSGSIFSLPEGDEEYLINTGKAETYESGGGGDTSGGRVRVVQYYDDGESLGDIEESWENLFSWFTACDLILLTRKGYEETRYRYISEIYEDPVTPGPHGRYKVCVTILGSSVPNINYSCENSTDYPSDDRY